MGENLKVRDAEAFLVDLNNNNKPILYLDTLKITTLENNSNSVYAFGGKGKRTLDRGDSDS